MTRYDWIVLGAGMTGLAAALRFHDERSIKPSLAKGCLVDAAPRAGGAIHTEFEDGYLLERGPDAFLTDKPHGLNLVHRLGLQSELLPTFKAHRRPFVLWHGKLIPVPEGFYMMGPTRWTGVLRSPLFSFRGKCRMALERWIPPRLDEEDESAAAFIQRRFGNEVYERAAQPMLSGVYAGDPQTLSRDALLCRFRAYETEHKSVTRGLQKNICRRKTDDKVQGVRYGLFVSFRGGMSQWVDAIKHALPADTIKLGTRVMSLERMADGGWRLGTQNGTVLETDRLVITLSAARAAGLLEPSLPRLGSELRSFRAESLATISFGFRRDQIHHPLNGFGFMVPVNEKRSLIGCSFSSIKFDHRAPKNYVLLRVFAGGAFGRHVLERSDEELVKTVWDDLKSLLHIKDRPHLVRLTRHIDAMPQYTLGHGARLTRIRQILDNEDGLELAGSSFDGAGLPDCIRQGEEAASRLFQKKGSFL